MSTKADIVVHHGESNLILDVIYDGYPAHAGAEILKTFHKRSNSERAIMDLMRNEALTLQVAGGALDTAYHRYDLYFHNTNFGPRLHQIGYRKRPADYASIDTVPEQRLTLDEFLQVVNEDIRHLNMIRRHRNRDLAEHNQVQMLEELTLDEPGAPAESGQAAREKVLASLDRFVDAASGLSRNLEHLDSREYLALTTAADLGEDYPFEESFDEVVMRIINWRDTSRKRLAGQPEPEAEGESPSP